MAVSLNASNDRNTGASQTVQGVGSLTDGLATWLGTSRDTNENYSGEAASINSVSATINSAFGTVGSNRIHIDIPYWVEAGFPTTGTASYTTTNTLDNGFQGSYVEWEGVDQSDPFDESEEKSETVASSAVLTELAPVCPAGGAVVYVGVTTGTHLSDMSDGFTLLRNFTPFSGVQCSIGYKLYPSGGTAAVRAIDSAVIGYHRAFVINPAGSGTEVAASKDGLTLSTYAATITIDNTIAAAKDAFTLATYQAAITSGAVSVPPNRRRFKQNRNLILSI